MLLRRCIGARRSGRRGKGAGQIEELSALVLRDPVVGANQIQRFLVGEGVAPDLLRRVLT